jgi:DNA-binding GntR family transcriptional regulator
MQANLDAGMELGFIEGDRSFHRTFVEMSRNQRLIDLYAHAPLPLWPRPRPVPPTPPPPHAARRPSAG